MSHSPHWKGQDSTRLWLSEGRVIVGHHPGAEHLEPGGPLEGIESLLRCRNWWYSLWLCIYWVVTTTDRVFTSEPLTLCPMRPLNLLVHGGWQCWLFSFLGCSYTHCDLCGCYRLAPGHSSSLPATPLYINFLPFSSPPISPSCWELSLPLILVFSSSFGQQPHYRATDAIKLFTILVDEHFHPIQNRGERPQLN